MDDTQPNSDQQPPRRRGVRVLLFVSLGLNLLIIGVAVGAVLRFVGPEPIRAPARSPGIEIVRALPPELRRDMFRELRAAGSDRRGAQRRDLQDLLDVLRADPFDRAAADAVMRRQGEARAGFETRLRAALLDKLEALPPEERALYAERLSHAMDRHPHKRSHKN